MNTASRAHALREKLTSGQTVSVTFTKADGTRRHMLCQYQGASSRSLDQVVVYDLEKQANRTVTMSRVHTVGIVQVKPRAAMKRAQAERFTALVEKHGGMDALFY